MSVMPPPSDVSSDIAAIARIASVDTILEVICRTTGMGFSAVARVTEDRWLACAVRDEIAFGLAVGGELKIESTLCNEVRKAREAIIIDHVAQDARYRNHPTPRLYGFQSYVSVPIYRMNGEFFGTLCAIDPKPAALKATATLSTFELFAQLISLSLDAQERLTERDTELHQERELGRFREQFIAVLGHDVRNPLAAIVAATAVLERKPDALAVDRMTAMIKRSAGRIGELVNSLLDFARGRFGGGLANVSSDAGDLTAQLNQVIQEFRASSPHHRIESEIALAVSVRCDAQRIEQLLSNLIANAITHGEKNGLVSVRAASDTETFVLSVSNRGTPIPAGEIRTLFEPFRGNVQNNTGLGLGLYICSEIARAHGGVIEVASTMEQTRFTFTCPQTPDTAAGLVAPQ